MRLDELVLPKYTQLDAWARLFFFDEEMLGLDFPENGMINEDVAHYQCQK